MIKLPKKIARTIEREFGSNCFVIKYIYIGGIYKPLCVSLVVFKVDFSDCYNILLYYGNDSYSMIGTYANREDVLNELASQLKKYYPL